MLNSDIDAFACMGFGDQVSPHVHHERTTLIIHLFEERVESTFYSEGTTQKQNPGAGDAETCSAGPLRTPEQPAPCSSVVSNHSANCSRDNGGARQ